MRHTNMPWRHAAELLGSQCQIKEGFTMAKLIGFIVLTPIVTWSALPFIGVVLHYAGADDLAIATFRAFYFFV